jgi:ribosomal protein RSM22 (predicted rRNA methylase)
MKNNTISLIEPERGSLTRNDEIRKELTAIAAGKSGLTPKSVLDVAKDPKSMLHSYFTWDDTEAARKYRELQAYDLIRRVKVTIETPEQKHMTIRAFWPVKQLTTDGTLDTTRPASYLPLADAMKCEQALEQIIAAAKSELRAFTVKYSQLEKVMEMADVFSVIRRVATA